jgi:hypothetical protein
MLTNSKIALSVAVALAAASAAAAAPKQAVRQQTATERQPYAGTDPDTGSSRSSDPVNPVFNPCYFKIQSIGNKEGNGMTPRAFSCVRLNSRRS